jgi:hypothetical protein
MHCPSRHRIVNREIAEPLVLSVRTVETHRARIQRRLGCRSRAQLVRWALDYDLPRRPTRRPRSSSAELLHSRGLGVGPRRSFTTDPSR